MGLTLFPTDWRTLWSGRLNVESTGAIFTKPVVVDLILDLAGYRTGMGVRLAYRRLLEPSCGDGAFLVRAVCRLIQSEAEYALSEHVAERPVLRWDDPALDHAISAGDINPAHVRDARETVTTLLVAAKCPEARAIALAERWILEADFLLEQWKGPFDVVVGNPPYVRIESLPPAVLELYRSTYHTMGDRADIYIPFIERGLSLLSEAGTFCYIVANRWTKNQYGRTLRALINARYHVHAYLDLAHTNPFVQDVSAYPCIVVLDRKQGAPTYAATLVDVEPATLDAVRRAMLPSLSRTTSRNIDGVNDDASVDRGLVRRFERWYDNGSAWITTSVDEHNRLTQMSADLPSLEESAPGTKVGIGVATGADRVFILKDKRSDVEGDRQLRLAMPGDPRNGGMHWSGTWVLNPFGPHGKLVNLAEYPGLRAFLEEHAEALRKRHVAKRSDSWYRTIDRIWPELVTRPKLLIRDIQDPNRPTVGYDPGEPGYYPHHNLYYVVSDLEKGWPLPALQCLLRSERIVSQVTAHSVAMRGGSIRWQAQVLRKLRVPPLASIPPKLLHRMTQAGSSEDTALINELANEAYGAVGA